MSARPELAHKELDLSSLQFAAETLERELGEKHRRSTNPQEGHVGRQGAAGSCPSSRMLFEASRQGHVYVIECLVESGAPLDAADNDGSTAAHLAAGSGRVEALEALARLGAPL